METLTSDQPRRFCVTVTVTNPGAHAVTWWTVLDPAAHGGDEVVSSYGVVTESLEPDGWSVRGEAYHAVLAAGATTEFGHCASRPEPRLTEVDVALEVTLTAGGVVGR